MKLSNLKRASDLSVENWLSEALELTPYQIDKLKSGELVRFAPFYFYKLAHDKKISFIWRLSIVLFAIYYVALVVFMPIKWIFTGTFGYGRNFIDNFHCKWIRKMGF